jgi:hypothetical protein
MYECSKELNFAFAVFFFCLSLIPLLSKACSKQQFMFLISWNSVFYNLTVDLIPAGFVHKTN